MKPQFGTAGDVLPHVASLAIESINNRCSYVPINGAALGIAEEFHPVSIVDTFTRPHIIDVSKPLDDGFREKMKPLIKPSSLRAKSLIRRIDQRIAALQTESIKMRTDPYTPHQADGAAQADGESDTTSLVELHPEDVSEKNTRAQTAGTDRILIIAPAGSGKTAVIDRTALWLASRISDTVENEQGSSESDAFREWLNAYISDAQDIEDRIPLLIRCRDLVSGKLDESGLSLLIVAAIFKQPLKDCESLAESLKTCDPSRFALLIDGLDELPESVSPSLLIQESSKLFRARETPSQANVIIFATTRAMMRGYSGIEDAGIIELRRQEHFRILGIMQLNELPEELRDNFILTLARSWYRSQHLDNDTAVERSSLLLNAITRDWTSRYRYYLRSPLDLILLLVLFSNSASLPSSEHELYTRYVTSRLRWRHGLASADNLLLQLSYCAFRAADLPSDQGPFPRTLSEKSFLQWMEASYYDLGTRIENYTDRGFKSIAAAARSDLDELIKVHGMLSCSNGEIAFEHNRLQAFFVENSLRAGACPRKARRVSYASIYSEKRKSGEFANGWSTVFSFFVQDPNAGSQALREIWEAVANGPNSGEYTSEESEVCFAILADGRITSADPKYLNALLEAFCSRTITSEQLDDYRELATGNRSIKVASTIRRLYESSGLRRYCFAAAALDIFKVMEPYVDHDEVERAASILENLDPDQPTSSIRLLHRMEMLFFFRMVGEATTSYSTYYFDGGLDRCNDAALSVLENTLALLPSCTADESEEIIRVMCLLSESKKCRELLAQAASSSRRASPESVLKVLALQAAVESPESPEYEELPSRSSRALWLLSALTTQGVFDDLGLQEPDAKTLRAYVKRSYMGAMRWAARIIFPPEDQQSQNAWDYDLGEGIECLCSADVGMRAFLESACRHQLKCAVIKEDGSQPLDVKFDPDEFSDRMERLIEQKGPLSSDIEEIRIAAASILNAERFGIVDETVAPFARKIVLLIQQEYSLRADTQEFSYPGETISTLRDEDMLDSMRRETRSVIREAREKPHEPNGQRLDELKFVAVDGKGRKILCETLFMFEAPATGKSYIVYTDNMTDDEGNMKVYASIYDPSELTVNESSDLAALRLEPIESDGEWKMIETILEEMQAATDA